MKLGPHFSLEEFLRSEAADRHGINMAPPPDVVDNLYVLVEQVLEPLRAAINEGRPKAARERSIIVTSGYRPRRLNTLIGGSRTSAHRYGRAADIWATGISVPELAEAAERLSRSAPIDQVILEFGRWVHIGLPPAGEDPRRQILTAVRRDDAVVYELGLVHYV